MLVKINEKHIADEYPRSISYKIYGKPIIFDKIQLYRDIIAKGHTSEEATELIEKNFTTLPSHQIIFNSEQP